MTTRARLRDLGISIGRFSPGRWNAITDVPGVTVGYSTIIRDEPEVFRSGVTAIWPRDRLAIGRDPVFAGLSVFNGNGEMSGSHWLREQGLLAGPVCITNTYSVGVVRDAVGEYARRRSIALSSDLPVVAETWDGWLSASEYGAILPEHVFSALDSAHSGALPEGNVGGGTGMICFEFKGGTGTASRTLKALDEEWVVGTLVQANFGRRDLLRVDGRPVGRELGIDVIPSAHPLPEGAASGSLIVVLASNAPLLPIQCQRLARRATLGMARVGGAGADGSGDLFLAFSTANHVQPGAISTVRMADSTLLSGLFEAAAESVEEAILNAMTAAETMTGQSCRVATAVPLERLQAICQRKP